MTAPAVTAHPDIVWHYTDGNGLISILAGHCLWATSAAFLNDEQEVALGVQRLADRFAAIVRDAGDDALSAAINPRAAAGPSSATFFILSASESWDSLAMWRLYGGARESYAVGLDATSPLRVLGEQTIDDAELRRSGVYLKPRAWDRVRYSAEDQDALVDAAFAELPLRAAELKRLLQENEQQGRHAALDSLSRDTTATVLRDAFDDLEQVVLLIKHGGFVDEREVRKSVVLFADPERAEAAELENQLLRYRATSYGIAPYLRLTGGGGEGAVTRSPEPLPIRAVAVSPSPNGPAAVASVKRLLEVNGYAGVPVLRSSIPFRG